ncbi:unnamed protein product [Protopolystoma xenopodis]|uniref:Uncharacterized protein n=1 Tax=Protopolystoma xenopodis TaxID=117903 RepID=A0A448XJZ7_9PLAT|nr:unnamed protein product [Protopolystoma xenopodis]
MQSKPRLVTGEFFFKSEADQMKLQLLQLAWNGTVSVERLLDVKTRAYQYLLLDIQHEMMVQMRRHDGIKLYGRHANMHSVRQCCS